MLEIVKYKLTGFVYYYYCCWAAAKGFVKALLLSGYTS